MDSEQLGVTVGTCTCQSPHLSCSPCFMTRLQSFTSRQLKPITPLACSLLQPFLDMNKVTALAVSRVLHGNGQVSAGPLSSPAWTSSVLLSAHSCLVTTRSASPTVSAELTSTMTHPGLKTPAAPAQAHVCGGYEADSRRWLSG